MVAERLVLTFVVATAFSLWPQVEPHLLAAARLSCNIAILVRWCMTGGADEAQAGSSHAAPSPCTVAT